MGNLIQYLADTKDFFIGRIHVDPSSDLFRLFGLIILFVILSYLINIFLVNSVLGPSYRIFVAPGIILHELSHSLLCVLTGAQITKVSFFDKNGGSVQHGPSRVPVLGPIMISLAPFFFGLIAIFFMARLIGLKQVDLSALHLSYDSVIHFIRSVFSQIDLHSWRNWLILYLTLSVAVTMTPSGQDLKNISLILILLGIVTFLLLRYTSVNLNLSFLPLQKIILLLGTVAILLILSLVLSMLVYAISKIFKH